MNLQDLSLLAVIVALLMYLATLALWSIPAVQARATTLYNRRKRMILSVLCASLFILLQSSNCSGGGGGPVVRPTPTPECVKRVDGNGVFYICK